MSSERYDRFEEGDEPPILLQENFAMDSQQHGSFDQDNEPSAYPPATPNAYPSPNSQPMNCTGPQYGQAYPQQTTPTGVVLTQPQTINNQTVMGTPPESFLAWSIVGCLCFLWPIGVYAIIASYDSRKKADKGDFEGAMFSSRRAFGYNLCNTIMGVIGYATIFGLLYQTPG